MLHQNHAFPCLSQKQVWKNTMIILKERFATGSALPLKKKGQKAADNMHNTSGGQNKTGMTAFKKSPKHGNRLFSGRAAGISLKNSSEA